MKIHSILATAFMTGIVAVAAASETLSLNGAWKLEAFTQPDDGAVRSLPLPAGLAVKSYPATVPGCCEEAVMRAGGLPDPMVSTNAFAWWAYEGHQWLYTKAFRCPARKPGERAVLMFDGIDTLAGSSTARRSAKRTTCSSRTNST